MATDTKLAYSKPEMRQIDKLAALTMMVMAAMRDDPNISLWLRVMDRYRVFKLEQHLKMDQLPITFGSVEVAVRYALQVAAEFQKDIFPPDAPGELELTMDNIKLKRSGAGATLILHIEWAELDPPQRTMFFISGVYDCNTTP